MNDNREFDDLPGGPLRERVKELKCLQGIVAVLDTPDLSPEKVFRTLIEIIPSGWQYPHLCQVRITYRNEVYQSPGFTDTPWIQRVPLRSDGAPVGSIEVSYSDETPGRRENPFLLEEKKLIELTANRLGQLIKWWEEGERADPREGGTEPCRKRKQEWSVIMDLLKETDPILYKRILRRLMNHLHWQGVPGIQGLLLQFTPEFFAGWPLEIRDENQPVPRRDVDALDKIFEEALWIASVALPDNEMSLLIKRWMRQDRFGYFLLATEKRDISLVEIKEIINRFCRSTSEDEQALSASDDLQARVAMIRRFLSERLRFTRVARDHMTLRDFDRLLGRVMGPSQGTGKLGGKASGLIVGESILRRKSKTNPGIGEFRIPNTWYIASDGLIDFIHYNFLEDFQSFKFLRIEEVKHNYPYLQQVFKHSFFSPEMFGQLKLILDDMGEGPLIVRSSSLLEDSRGTAFSGKYRSLFLANTGSKEERLTAMVDAVSEVYASIFNPDAIQYRAERGLLDYYEEMGILIQHVVGRRVGRYFFPAFAGVAFCNNEFRWSPRLRREDGVLRLVTGLGTRAVDRVENDYPALISPGQPAIRVNVMPEEAVHYAQRFIDVINMDSGRLETRSIDEVLKEVGDAYPLWDRIFSISDGAIVRKVNPALDHPGGEGMIAKFDGLVEDTGFIRQMKEIMRELKETFGTPMDIEFAHDGTSLYILQCRPQSFREEEGETRIPKGIPEKMKLFSASRFVMNGRVKGIRTIVYIDPEGYGAMTTQGDMAAVGDAVSRLNNMLPKKSFILMGPGRWGSRGDVRLGVKVGYSDINNSAMLVEIARKVGNYVPDLSFGTHFFQDLVEADIRYLALYPDEEGAIFSQNFFRNSPNSLANLLPECEYLSNVIKVIDVPAVADGCEVCIVMDGDGETGLGFLCRPGSGD